ncbi:MAG TPA: hypothetical protein VFM70_02695 [Salinimicrobium sp.]|nr:hypothetical protein [Salinimicrobium sp.]
MNYEIHIKDTENIEDALILHYASRNSISLSWLGGDNKTQAIIGSELNFTLEVLDGEDGKYDNYFTSDEQRFEVTKVIQETQEVIWRGFLLPESYSEPYEFPLFYVQFSAVDGLGLLKGKKLPSDFYEDEKTVIEVIAKCLELTGLDFDIYLAPAIRNHLKWHWHEVFIDTKKYYDEDQLPSAYELLEEIIFSMRCQLFQADARWYIEGINKRQTINITYSKYSITGEYLTDVNLHKNVKVLTWAPSPTITMVAPYKEVVVMHEAAQLEFPEDVVSSTPDFNALENGTNSYYLNKYWDPNNGYDPDVRVKDDCLFMANYSMAGTFFENRKVSLREKLYLLKDWRVRITLEVELYGSNGSISNLSDSQIEEVRDYAVFRISLNGNALYFNLNSSNLDPERLEFDSSGKASVELDFRVKENGFLQVEFFEPFTDTDICVAYIVKNLEIENRNQSADDVYIATIEENATQTNEIELPISDDVSGLSKCFYLEKKRARNLSSYTSFTINVYNTFVKDDVTYFVTDITGAVLINNHKEYLKAQTDFAYYNFTNVEVIFNFENSEEFVFTDGTLFSQSLIDSFNNYQLWYYGLKNPTIEREEWLKWTDAIYQIEEKPYNQVVAEIGQKLFSVQHLRMEATAMNPVKINDVIRFNWKGQNKYFVPTNCEWFPDENETNLTLVEGIYNGDSFGNLPPYVEAGEDLVLIEDSGLPPTPLNVHNAYVTTAVTFDPDGNIESILWEKLEGDEGDVITGATTLTPTFSSLTGDYYKYQLTVTDSNGATASDTLEINRYKRFQISKTLVDSSTYSVGDTLSQKMRKYKLITTPSFPENVMVNLMYDVFLDYTSLVIADVYLIIEKNGQSYMWQITREGGGTSTDTLEDDGVLSFRPGDEIFITVYTSLQILGDYQLPANATAQIVFSNHEIVSGYPLILGFPFEVILYDELE